MLLTLVGLVVLHSISLQEVAPSQSFNPVVQIMAALLGIAAMIVMARLDYRLLVRIAPMWYMVAIGLLALVLIVGETVSGATRSIELGFFEFQPTEVAKIGLILMMARYYSMHSHSLGKIRYVLGSLLLLGFVAAFILMQPDLGSVVLISAVWFIMTAMSSMRRVYVVALIVIAAAMIPVVSSQLEPYQQARISSFFDPAADPQGQGYNVNQAMIAVGSGQLLGRGLGGGTQSSLNFIPAQHTDFIFAVLAEKLGLLGGGVVIALFGVVIWRGILIAYRARDRFGMLLAVGVVSAIFVQTVITIGMNLGVAPVTGLPLPFIAYGGTSLMMSLFAIGILQSIATHSQELHFRD